MPVVEPLEKCPVCGGEIDLEMAGHSSKLSIWCEWCVTCGWKRYVTFTSEGVRIDEDQSR